MCDLSYVCVYTHTYWFERIYYKTAPILCSLTTVLCGGLIIKYTAFLLIIECVWYLWPTDQCSYFTSLCFLFSGACGFQMPLFWIAVCRVVTMVLRSCKLAILPDIIFQWVLCLLLSISHCIWFPGIKFQMLFCSLPSACLGEVSFIGQMCVHQHFQISLIRSPLVGIFLSNGRIICFPQNNLRVKHIIQA